ncbi:probable proline--tRNA ligase, mitochondrial isoform X1 [Hylaeus volcanicus]|uniref:probable proline--tRNA ligase, mitochondrial isoform X1 n=2 Tax=Hylaeus volcanicus TaxID=313075 RepID=UPI0023B85E9E|nr:probable proline--tRNA ligase, mitochondrial isoform X1 [Hylaeus volcanicus]
MSNIPIRNINRLSRLFQPVVSTLPSSNTQNPKNVSQTCENLIKYGLIKPVNNGMYAVLPLGLRVLNKLINLVENEMETIGAQKISLPALTSTALWKRTDRFESNQSELFKVQDRHNKQYILSPTYEETICDLIASVGGLSPKVLPLKLYQISNKWRDEMKPRLGFLRSKEFVMKDLYTFDTTLENAQETYELICNAYDNILKKIGITFKKAIGDTGTIGGLISHEYHYATDIGEDIICSCSSCQYSINKVVCNDSHCPKCNNTLVEQHTAEVGHTFLLDTKYTKPLKAVYRMPNHKVLPLAMGCFGLGLSRIFTVAAEILSTNDELRWPKCIAPYTVCVIPPKTGSKEDPASQYIDHILGILNQLNIDAVLDDRTQLTIGNRFILSRITGFPYIIVIGRSAMKSPPLFEIHNINDSTNCEITLESIHNYFNTEINKS